MLYLIELHLKIASAINTVFFLPQNKIHGGILMERMQTNIQINQAKSRITLSMPTVVTMRGSTLRASPVGCYIFKQKIHWHPSSLVYSFLAPRIHIFWIRLSPSLPAFWCKDACKCGWIPGYHPRPASLCFVRSQSPLYPRLLSDQTTPLK